MRTVLHTKTAGRPKALLAVALVLTAVIALILVGCDPFAPAGYIKGHTISGPDADGGGQSAPEPVDLPAGSSENDADFGPGATITSVINVSSGGTTLYYYLKGIEGIAGNHVINLPGGQTHDFLGIITPGAGVKISLRGADTDVIHYAAAFSLFEVNGAGARLTLRGPTLQGYGYNNYAVVKVTTGDFYLQSGTITGNTNSNMGGTGGGVYVGSGGRFFMSGGTISNNAVDSGPGGGVYVNGGKFIMSGGTIRGNDSSGGGGVRVAGDGIFIMSYGSINENTAASGGGGVDLERGTFTMSGGFISGNTASGGGGMYIGSYGTFTMSGGSISGNIAGGSSESLYKSSGGTANYSGVWGTGNILQSNTTDKPLPYPNSSSPSPAPDY